MDRPLILFNVLGTCAVCEQYSLANGTELSDQMVHHQMRLFPRNRFEERYIAVERIQEVAPYGECDGFKGMTSVYLDAPVTKLEGNRVVTFRQGLMVQGDITAIQSKLKPFIP